MSRTATPTTAPPSDTPANPAPAEALTAPLRGLLAQIDTFVTGLPDGRYAAAPPAHLAGTIGGHVRHCLDHIAVLAKAHEHPKLDYDHRDRGTPVEKDPRAAHEAIRTLCSQLKTLDADASDTPLLARLKLSPHQPARDYATTLGREVAFVLSHTVHHQALLAAAARAAGQRVPDDFGVAPSTLQHRAS